MSYVFSWISSFAYFNQVTIDGQKEIKLRNTTLFEKLDPNVEVARFLSYTVLSDCLSKSNCVSCMVVLLKQIKINSL